MTTLRTYSGLLGWIAVSFLAGTVGSIFSPDLWYANLEKPGWTPPDAAFSIVWPVLYLFMGIAAWLIWKDFGFYKARSELTWFVIQLVLNAVWTVIFFGLHLIALALVEILILWTAIFCTMMLFWERNTYAGILLLPYLLWVSFASALNFAIWSMN